MVTAIFAERKEIVALRQSMFMKVAVIVYLIAPMIVYLHSVDSSLGQYNLMVIDVCCNWIFSAVYVFRVSGKGIVSVLNGSLFEKQEFMVFCFLTLQGANTLRFIIKGVQFTNSNIWMMCSTILRIHIMTIFFPQIQSIFRILYICIPAFVPQILYVIMVIFIFGILGNDVFKGLQPHYGDNKFLEQNFNFQNFGQSFALLLAMGTGNVWTEVIAAFKNSAGVRQGIGAAGGSSTSTSTLLLTVAIDGFFLLFVFFFQVSLRTFPLIIIYSYLTNSGGTLGLAGQQIREFQAAWQNMANKSMRLFVTCTYHEFFELLKTLPPPLGRLGLNVSYLDSSRFAKRVLLCMPTEVMNGADNFDTPKGLPAFTMDSLPDDIR